MRVVRNMTFLPVLAIVCGMVGPPVTAQDVCPERSCEIGSEAEQCGPEQICDMVRNSCVPECEGGDCCAGFECPDGTTCVPGRGQCGSPAGQACFELGTSWSTVSNDHDAEAPSGTVDFVVLNRSGQPLFFQASMDRPRVRFDIFTPVCGEDRALELPENKFCPNWCPASGPVPELDCARPDPVVIRLDEGDGLRVTWSGTEAATVYRACASSGVQSCLRETPTKAGRYAVEICANSAMEAQDGRDGGTGRIERAQVAGQESCVREDFAYPGRSEIVLTFEN